MTEPASPAESLRLNWWQRALMPNLPVIAALAVLYLAVVVMGPQGLLNDSDTGWHIVTGERIIDTGQLPRTDPYSFSKPGEPWFAWEWLADVILGAAHKWMGLAGVVLIACLAIAATAWMWCAFSLWLGSNPFVVAALMAVAISSSTIHWHARPHVFSWPLLIGWLWLLEKTPSRLSAARIAFLFLLMAVWTNLHGSFFLAFFLSGAYFIQFWFEDRRRAAAVAIESAVALAATFCNPYGWQLHVHLIRYLTDSRLLALIQEFKSPDFQGDGGVYFVALFLAAAVGGVSCLEQREFARALVVALLAVIGLRSTRGIALVAFVAIPLAACSITLTLSRLTSLREYIEESANFLWVERQCNGAAILCLVLLGTIWWFSSPHIRAAVQFPPKKFPVKAALKLAQLDLDARVFAPDKYGGYLIYRFRGTRKVFFDGRSDFYGQRFIAGYVRVVSLKPGWRDFFRQFRFGYALLPQDYALREALECSGWQRIHADSTAVLLRRPELAPSAPVCAFP